MGSPRRQVSANPRNDEPADGSVRVELDSELCANSAKRRKCVTDSGKAALAEATSLKEWRDCVIEILEKHGSTTCHGKMETLLDLCFGSTAASWVVL